MKMRAVAWAGERWGLLLVISAAVLIFAFLPLGTALEFGGDEGYELMKAFLCSRGFSLYTQIWNDQPPVHTMLLCGVFKMFGPSLLAARLVAAGFGLLLFVTLYQLVRTRSVTWSALFAAFFLMASPGALSLSVSVMLEVPAIGTALVSAWLVFQWRRSRHWGWLVASGAVMGAALEMKLTSIVVAPAILGEIILLRRAETKLSWRRGAMRDALRWGMVVAAVFLVIGAIWGAGSYQSSWKSHFREHEVSGLRSPDDFRLNPRVFVEHAECVAAAAVGILLAARRKRWREVAFPLLLLMAALAVHSVHRPWWPYYYLHLAVPLSWLAGWASGEVIGLGVQFWTARKVRLSSVSTWKWAGVCALTALALAVAEARLEAGIRELRKVPRASQDRRLAKMREYANRTHWVYAEPVVYPFHAKLLVPPELAVVVLKRFWSGQITTKEIVELCRRYHPEQLLLFKKGPVSEWKELLESEYVVAYRDKDYVLYVAKRIEAK